MRDLESWFSEYSISHQNPVNKLIHWICVPSIFFSIIALLASLPSSGLQSALPESMSGISHWGTAALLFVLVFYFRLSVSMGIAMTLFSILCLVGVSALTLAPIPLWLSSLLIFIPGWIGQFIGHKIEGQKPSFFKDVQFLLIGPAWLMSAVFRMAGIRY